MKANRQRQCVESSGSSDPISRIYNALVMIADPKFVASAYVLVIRKSNKLFTVNEVIRVRSSCSCQLQGPSQWDVIRESIFTQTVSDSRTLPVPMCKSHVPSCIVLSDVISDIQ